MNAPATTRGPHPYALNGGIIDIADMDAFADTGEYAGQASRLVVSCYLVDHPRGYLAWDCGLGDHIAALPDGLELVPGSIGRVPLTLEAQLGALGLTFKNIRYFAHSHVHPDHIGNANAFTDATWILNRRELEWLHREPTPFALAPELMSAWRSSQVRIVDGDFDVFGDGTVKIVSAPGHTPGHQALQLDLANAGRVILAGDLYYARHNQERHCVPSFNTSRAETLASFDRIDRIVRNSSARLISAHSKEDAEALPAFPAYLD
jgi:N-acyl homoserine lactone hydrolase